MLVAKNDDLGKAAEDVNHEPTTLFLVGTSKKQGDEVGAKLPIFTWLPSNGVLYQDSLSNSFVSCKIVLDCFISR